MSDQELEKDIQEHVAKHVVQYKKLRGGVRFIDVIPKGYVRQAARARTNAD